MLFEDWVMSVKIRWAAFAALVLSALAYALWPLAIAKPSKAVAPSVIRPEPQRGEPAFRLTPATLDFGAVPVGTTRSAELTVTNTSANPVTVYRVSGSCECIGGEIEPKVLPPGTSARARIRFTGVPGKGTYTGSASLVTDESGPCKYEIPVRGIVLEELMIEPSVLSFGMMPRKAVVFREARLRHKDGKPFEIKEVTGVSDPFEVTVSKSPGAQDGGYVIQGKMMGLRPGHLTRQVTLVTDCAAMPTVTLNLKGEVESDFRITPKIAAAKQGSGEVFPTYEVVVENTKKEPFRVRSVRDSRNTSLEYKAGDLDDSRRTLRIKLTDVPKEAVPVGDFLISVDREEEPLHLPYRVEDQVARPQGKQ
jgi:hypothetical protein